MTETLTRAAPGLSSLDAEAREIDAVLASETPVRRRDWESGGFFDEVLSCAPSAIDTARLDSLAVLDGHRDGSIENRLGAVVPGSLRFEKGQAIVRIKLSRNAKADAVLSDLADGMTLNTSLGYRITATEKTEAPRGGTATVRATRWEPLELSVVQIPADPTAKTRSIEGNEMTTKTEKTTRSAADEARIIEIATMARMSEMGAEAVRSGESLADFRERLLDAMAARDDAMAIDTIYREPSLGNQRNRADAMADALMYRVDPAHKPANDAREFVGLSLGELARRCVEATGADTRGMSMAGIVTRGLHSTSDFPALLANTAGKRLQAEFAAVPSALKRTARQSSAKDFKLKTLVKLSSAPDLLKVNEGGEFKRGSVSEASESYKIETFGRIFGITRQALVNDDLDAFMSLSAKMGAAAGVFEAKTLSELVEANPVMADGNPVFHASHANLTDGPLSIESLSAARLLFRQQVGLASDLVDLSPRYLIVPAALETTAEKLLADITAAKTDDVPAAARGLELVVEPRLTDATAWYLAAAPGQAEGLQYSYLEGQEGPFFETRYGFDVDGVELKVRLDFGAAFVDHRAWVKSSGDAV